jgi:HEAT repeat protein
VLSEVLGFLGRAAESAAAARIGSAEPPPDAAETESFYLRLIAGDKEAWQSPLVGTLMRRAVIDLRQCARELIEAVIEFADDQEVAVRIAAVGALAQMGVPASAAPLAAGLVDILRLRLDAIEDRTEKANVLMAVGRLAADTLTLVRRLRPGDSSPGGPLHSGRPALDAYAHQGVGRA